MSYAKKYSQVKNQVNLEISHYKERSDCKTNKCKSRKRNVLKLISLLPIIIMLAIVFWRKATFEIQFNTQIQAQLEREFDCNREN